MAERVTKVLGYDAEAWLIATPAEKRPLWWAAVLFIVSAVATFTGSFILMYQLTGSWITTLLGGLFVGFTLTSFIRLSLITVVARRPGSVRVRAYRSIAQKITGKIFQLKVSTIMRIVFIGLFCLAATVPTISVLMNKKRLEILEYKRTAIIVEFKKRHPDYAQERIEKYLTSVSKESFPIHAYIRLAHELLFWIIWLPFAALFYLPFLLIYQARRNYDRAAIRQQQQTGVADVQSSSYFWRVDALLTSTVEEQYQETLKHIQKVIDDKYRDVHPVAIKWDVGWVNPPFNTIPRTMERNYVKHTNWHIFSDSY